MDHFGFGNSALCLLALTPIGEGYASTTRAPRLRYAALHLFARRSTMTESNTNTLHGATLDQILNAQVQPYAWSGLAARHEHRCFNHAPRHNRSASSGEGKGCVRTCNF